MRKRPHCWSLFEKTADELTKKSTMNVSWTDLNYVQEAGDYSFRDGTISVTFVEVAIWKNNPSAQFQLMRKHPIQGSPRYVVGRRVEEGLASENSFAHLRERQRRLMVSNQRSSNGRSRRNAQSQYAIWRPSIVRRNRKIPVRRRERTGTPGTEALDRKRASA
jgi:hypothetical protein